MLAGAPAVVAGGADALRQQSRRATRSHRRSRSIRVPRPRSSTASMRQPELLDTLAPLVGILRARTEGGLSMLRTNFSTRPFYNDRAIRIGIGVGVLVTAAAHGVQRRGDVVAQSAATARLVEQADASEARATALRAQATAIEQTLNREGARRGANGGARSESADRSPRLFVDRLVQPLRGNAAARCPHPGGVAAGRSRREDDGGDHDLSRRRLQDLDIFCDRLEASGAFSEVISRQEEEPRRRHRSAPCCKAITTTDFHPAAVPAPARLIQTRQPATSRLPSAADAPPA